MPRTNTQPSTKLVNIAVVAHVALGRMIFWQLKKVLSCEKAIRTGRHNMSVVAKYCASPAIVSSLPRARSTVPVRSHNTATMVMTVKSTAYDTCSQTPTSCMRPAP